MDVLVNCAGINLYKDPFDYSDEDWDRVVGVDLTGTWKLLPVPRPAPGRPRRRIYRQHLVGRVDHDVLLQGSPTWRVKRG